MRILIFVTSDLHIGHNKEFVYDSRGFNSIEEHDAKLVENWNSAVTDEDTVYVLGDVMLKHDLEDTDFSYGLRILSQLHGKLFIIRGNHDTINKIEKYKTCPNVIAAGAAAEYIKYPEIGAKHFYLSHYPTLVAHEKLKPVKSAMINLYGHTHQMEHFYNDHPYMYCVCLDAHDMKPVLIDDIIAEIIQKRSSYKEKG